MTTRFADTSFFVSYLSRRDAHHATAVGYMDNTAEAILTTRWVLLELGNFLSKVGQRRLFVPFLRRLQREPHVALYGSEEPLFEQGARLYQRRPDKDWSLTDCISFVVMKQEGLTEALTADHHFEQARFIILLKKP